jgi:hypothetical protein
VEQKHTWSVESHENIMVWVFHNVIEVGANQDFHGFVVGHWNWLRFVGNDNIHRVTEIQSRTYARKKKGRRRREKSQTSHVEE